MKKIILGAILILFIIVGFGVYYVLSNMDDVVQTAIETYGSEAAKTAVRVEKVQLDFLNGSGAIFGLTVENPTGYAMPQLFSLGEISTDIDLGSLFEEVIIIEQITVRAPEIFYELNETGKTNLDELKQNISSSVPASSSTSSQASGKEPKLIIKKLLFIDGNVNARLFLLKKEYKLKLPKIEMNDLGGENGATPAQIAEQVLKVLADRGMAEVEKKGLGLYKKKLEGEVNKRLESEQQKLNEKVGEQVGEEVGEKLKGLLNY